MTLSVDLTLNIGGKDVVLSYDEGKELYDALRFIYNPLSVPSNQAKQDFFTEQYEASDTATATSSCGSDLFDAGKGNGGNNATCANEITVSTAPFADRKADLGSATAAQNPKDSNDEDLDEPDLDEMNAEIDKRIQQMKELIKKQDQE